MVLHEVVLGLFDGTKLKRSTQSTIDNVLRRTIKDTVRMVGTEGSTGTFVP